MKKRKKIHDETYCQALNQAGELCGSKVMPGSKYCKVHLKKQFWWYKVWDEHKTLVFIMSIISIGLGIWGITSSLTKKDVEEVTAKNIVVSRPSFDSLKTQQKEFSIKLDSLLKQPKDLVEYEKNKDTLSKLTSEYIKGIVKKETKRILDSAITSNKTIVKEISQKPILWSDLFPDGYGLFYIGYDNKANIYWNIDSSKIKVSKEMVKINKISDKEVEFILPELVIENRMTIKNNFIGLPRRFESLNRFTYTAAIGLTINNHDTDLNVGIISDNHNGLVGIIGFGNLLDKPNNRKPILDYNKLKFAYK